jgi:purine-binding chemotaxis protein CheW
MMPELEVTAEKHVAKNTHQVLLVKMGEVLACIGLESVERTFSLVALQTMPGGAPYVAGIMNFAGSSLPVIDLAIRLGLPSAPYKPDTPIVVCAHEGQRVGLIVMDIIGIQNLQEQEQQLTRELARYGAAFRASVHTKVGLALLLDSAWLTQPELYRADLFQGGQV